jgi:hypothetical protein
MSCEIANGRLEPCKDSVAGIDAIYFVNFGDYTSITYDGTNPDVIDSVAGVSSLYKYELKGTNSFDQVYNSSRENGTTFAEQTLTVTLKKQDATTHKNVKLMAYGRPHIVVKNRNNQFFLAGLEHGMEITTANVSNGTAMGDLNGYTLTFVGTEKLYANLLDCSSEAGLAGGAGDVFGTATIVTV